MKKISIFHFVHNIGKESGGLRYAILGIHNLLKEENLFFSEIHSFKKSNIIDSGINHKNIKLSFKLPFIIDFFRFFLTGKSTKLRTIINSRKRIIHLHGMWTLMPLMGYLIAKILNIPYIFSPHGMLMPNSLAYHSKRKRIALIIFQKLIINQANLIIVASEDEYRATISSFKNKNIVTIPHAISLPVLKDYKRSNKLRQCLFLGRINPQKGVMELISAWKKIDPENWKLTIAGIHENKIFIRQIKRFASQEINKGNIEILHEVDGLEKESLFRNSDLFVLPTKSENFGIVIAEALSYGIPVITTKAAPWQIIKENNLGWWIESNNESLIYALQEALIMKKDDLNQMGINAYQYAKNKLSWERTKSKYIIQYKQLK